MQAEGDGIEASAEGREEAALSLPPPNEILSSSDMILGKLVDEVEQKGFNVEHRGGVSKSGRQNFVLPPWQLEVARQNFAYPICVPFAREFLAGKVRKSGLGTQKFCLRTWPKAGIIFGPSNSPIALFQKESSLFSANSFLLYPVRSIPTSSDR